MKWECDGMGNSEVGIWKAEGQSIGQSAEGIVSRENSFQEEGPSQRAEPILLVDQVDWVIC